MKEVILNEIREKIEYLERHNKNYNKTQYYTILDLKELIEKLEK